MKTLKNSKSVNFAKDMTTIILETIDGSMSDFKIGDQYFRGGSKVEWTNYAGTITISENVDVECSVPFEAKVEKRDLNTEMPRNRRQVV